MVGHWTVLKSCFAAVLGFRLNDSCRFLGRFDRSPTLTARASQRFPAELPGPCLQTGSPETLLTHREPAHSRAIGFNEAVMTLDQPGCVGPTAGGFFFREVFRREALLKSPSSVARIVLFPCCFFA